MSKTAVVPETMSIADLVATLRVISEETRLRILGLLVRQEMCVCDLMEALGLGQSLVSHHLGVLRRTGLVRDRRESQWVYYSIDPERLAELNADFLHILGASHLTPEAAYGASPHRRD
ncbi:MAG: metalloregulator ArsR/SmtB family transcription factor [Anaerolineae bacterium]|nr:metalloregulator ArsR/SmtB family transcription factor [Anaerolineae bacterium]